jgi:Glycosyltransferase family 87
LSGIGSTRSSFWTRLQAAAANFLGNPRVLWVLAGIIALRRALADVPVFLPPGADAYGFIDSGRRALSDPAAIYPSSAAAIAAGNPFTLLWPPSQTLIAVPFSLLPPPADVWVWVAANALMSVIGLYLLYRAIGLRARWTLPTYVLTLLCFTPLFEDIRLGQRGGPLMLLAGAAMLAIRARPALAGALIGVATTIKFYPAALVLSVAPRQWTRFTGALAAVATVVFAVTFIPFGNPLFYVTRVLIPTMSGNTTTASRDCFQNSTSLLFTRLVGGQGWTVGNDAGVWHTVTLFPWHLAGLAQALTYLTIGAVFAGTIWATRRSGWAQPYSMALAFSLGTLVPAEVFTYQFIPMLPLTLVLLLKAIELHRWATVVVVIAALYILLSSPCALVFPGLWTIAGLVIFVAAVVEAPRFRKPSPDSSEAQLG